MAGNIRNRDESTTESASLPAANHKEWIEVTNKSDKDPTIKHITGKEKSPVFDNIRYFKLKEDKIVYVKFVKLGSSDIIAWGVGEDAGDAVMKCKDGLVEFINKNSKDEPL